MNDVTVQQTRKRILLGAILWVLCLQFFVAERVVAHAFTPEYSFAYGYISDLGTTDCDMTAEFPACSPRHLYMNFAFMAQGVFMAAGALATRRAFNAHVGFTVATTAILLSGVSILWMGLAPVSIAHNLHVAMMNLHLLLGGLGVLLYAVMLFVRPGEIPPLAVGSLFFGVPISLAAILVASGNVHLWDRVGFPQGMVQRVASYGIPLWLITMGIVLLARKGREAPRRKGIYLPPPPPPRMREDAIQR
jgi:hypothetical membrane protein